MIIKRHNTDADYLRKEFYELQGIIGNTIKSALEYGTLNMLLSEANSATSYSVYFQKEKEAVRFIDIALECLVSIFSARMSPNAKIAISIEGHTSNIEAEEVVGECSTGDWQMTLSRAIIRRNKRVIDLLLNVSEDTMRKSKLKGDEYNFLYVDFLKSLFSEKDDAPEKLMKAYEATDPNVLKIADADSVLKSVVPAMDLYVSFIEKDHKEFNVRLATALELYKQTAEELKYSTRSKSHLWAGNLTAIAALAYDNGFPIEVESDYMPRWMIEGKF